ncbi:hypothetical protein [Streptomyces mexicanus]|uniref:Uncharacterized protein n=1 Tax=Streptomyces mexicanus TaxID=178566 RepID=A0A7X1HWF9_9ACTN|nr:hypothetical protein [Streptomyces mexicanus]MBC2864420.1 hypothetical protein [Streptomyces mexicanus]
MICTICDQPIEDDEPRKRVQRRDRFGVLLPPAYTHKQCRRRPSTVPFIASWSGESVADAPVVYRLLGGIGYAGEVASDRDDRGVLWLRRPSRPGTGRPLYGVVHPGRQRLAMARLLCQVCGEPADRDDRGVLWLLEDERADWDGWPNDLVTTHPPICRSCLRTAREECPHLWAGSVAVRVGTSVACGVWGRRYTASRGGPIPAVSEVTPFESPLLGWTIASQLVRALYDCTIVSLDEEIAAHA